MFSEEKCREWKLRDIVFNSKYIPDEVRYYHVINYEISNYSIGIAYHKGHIYKYRVNCFLPTLIEGIPINFYPHIYAKK